MNPTYAPFRIGVEYRWGYSCLGVDGQSLPSMGRRGYINKASLILCSPGNRLKS
jgi:hypothetical protein